MIGESENERAGNCTLKEKIRAMIASDDVKQKVLEKLESMSISNPCLKLEILDSKSEDFMIEEPDVLKVFECFGEVTSLKIQGKNAIITYKDIVSAYFAIKILDGKELPELNMTLQVSWHIIPEVRIPLKELPIKETPLIQEENLKYTCRFDIQIDNDKEFQVARRVIGSKGYNMKRIIEKCCKGMNAQAHDIIKLRLRGIGSGFKEGPYNTESQDSLHLCVSSKYHNKFDVAVNEIETLLKKVYRDYGEYCIAKGMNDPKLTLMKTEKTSGRAMILAPSKLKEIEENERLTDDDIEELIDIRNEARRQCNFAEADRIRELLRKKGITLMDEKGRRGRGVEVTTWKYGKL
ncbi:hypothetical protein SteCoe_17985 [Stentor coeruleus]|uniref:KHDC4/BBP-like KH-domain type I domain-containing protein n=1 Tax=Stentor coeruleus TaxID=5963 RepID=A0A1R2BXG9_9CILI|nr:hypothetical protein SteCoe_17985 [Stentor coeruleus]